jgi:hypothetical protein
MNTRRPETLARHTDIQLTIGYYLWFTDGDGATDKKGGDE